MPNLSSGPIVVADPSVQPGEIRFVQDGQVVGRITNLGPEPGTIVRCPARPPARRRGPLGLLAQVVRQFFCPHRAAWGERVPGSMPPVYVRHCPACDATWPEWG